MQHAQKQLNPLFEKRMNRSPKNKWPWRNAAPAMDGEFLPGHSGIAGRLSLSLSFPPEKGIYPHGGVHPLQDRLAPVIHRPHALDQLPGAFADQNVARLRVIG